MAIPLPVQQLWFSVFHQYLRFSPLLVPFVLAFGVALSGELSPGIFKIKKF